jgi:hypothetical protein
VDRDISSLPWVGLDDEQLRVYRVALTLQGPIDSAALAAAGGISTEVAT